MIFTVTPRRSSGGGRRAPDQWPMRESALKRIAIGSASHAPRVATTAGEARRGIAAATGSARPRSRLESIIAHRREMHLEQSGIGLLDISALEHHGEMSVK